MRLRRAAGAGAEPRPRLRAGSAALMKSADAAIAAPVTRSELAAMPVAPGAAAERDDDGGGGLDRERLCNDILNTGVMGALIGGFALSNLQAGFDTAVTLDVAIYLTSFIGVHACTCSCVTSALLCEIVILFDLLRVQSR